MPTLASLSRDLRRLRALCRPPSPPASPVLGRLRADPTLPLRAMGWAADPWQAEFLGSTASRESLLCSRQAGKSTATAAAILREALLVPRADCLVFSPTLRQSTELLRKVREFHAALGRPVATAGESRTALELANGSRVLSLPDSPGGVVGFAPRLVVIDEGSRVSDELYAAVRPMLAVSRGRLVTLSTPFGAQGWFWRVWDDSAEGLARRARLNEQWRRTAVAADQVPRITPEFLADERVELGERWFAQEYHLAFLDAVDAVFAQAVIRQARSDEVEPLFGEG